MKIKLIYNTTDQTLRGWSNYGSSDQKPLIFARDDKIFIDRSNWTYHKVILSQVLKSVGINADFEYQK